MHGKSYGLCLYCVLQVATAPDNKVETVHRAHEMDEMFIDHPCCKQCKKPMVGRGKNKAMWLWCEGDCTQNPFTIDQYIMVDMCLHESYVMPQ